MKSTHLGVMLTFLVLVAAAAPFQSDSSFAQDIEGSKDHPLISRYPGSTITNYTQKEFDE